MPYMKVKRSDEICIYKRGADNNPEGESLGCHPDEGSADRQIRAILAATHAEKSGGWCVTLKEMESLCPSCADTMQEHGYDRINLIRLKQMPEPLKRGLCAKFGGDPGMFTRCIESSFAGQVDDKESFCAWLHHECLGIWPGEHKEKEANWVDRFLGRIAAAFKVGARHNLKDNEMVQGIHDNAIALGATCKVVKQSDGSYRWVLISSSAYQDRDGEIVSQKALEADVARADAEKDYGPLLWWHEPRLPIGDADFNATHGPMLIESGTFKSAPIADKFKAHSDTLGGSIAFNHPLTEPDSEGVFKTIRRFERSILPKEKASNLFTRFSVKESDMEKEKLDALKAIVGDDLAEQVIQAADAQEKQADAAGIRRKEDQAAIDVPAADVAPVTQTTTPEALAQVIAQAIATALAPIQVEVAGIKETLADGEQAKAKAESERQKAVNDQAAKVTALEAQLTEAQKSLKELTGDLPRGVARGYRASQDEATITKDERLKASVPQADPISEFVNSFVMPAK